MKYAEALTNLHKSGINKNSTPQEIAAASVGTTVNKNGTPNISSVSQGQSYGSALKNLKSNPQPNVNQNSNGAKPNTTGSQNNTGNKANINPTGSTKPSGSTTANRSANSTSSSTRLSNADYNRLAAQIVGVPTDKNGNPVCNSYEQYMQFGKTLANLHNGGINANSTPHEIAAASIGAKNNTPNIFNPSQLMGYSKALVNLLKGTQQEVSYVDTVPTGSKKPEDKISTISSQYTPEEIKQLEIDEGTMYVWRHVYHKDSSKYNYLQKAEENAKLKVSDIRNKEDVDKLNEALYGVNNKNEIWHQTSGINYSDGNMDKIPCQSTKYGGEFDGMSGCVSTSIAAMFRINDNAVGSASELVQCNDNGTNPRYGKGNYNFNKFGKTPNGSGINQDEALKLIKTSLSNGDVCCVKLDKGTSDGHTVVCSGVREGVSLEDATWEDLLFKATPNNAIKKQICSQKHISVPYYLRKSALNQANKFFLSAR